MTVVAVGHVPADQLDRLRVELADRDDWGPRSHRAKTRWHHGWDAARIVSNGAPVGPHAPEAIGLVLELAAAAQWERVVSVWWARLDIGGALDEHTDPEPFERFGRYHVPVLSDGTARLVSLGVEHDLAPGRIYRVDVTAPHAVRGPETAPRVHLCIDAQLSPEPADTDRVTPGAARLPNVKET